jgi:hypothetical protein
VSLKQSHLWTKAALAHGTRNSLVAIVLYVDEFYIFFSDRKERVLLFAELDARFRLKDL